MNVIASLHLSFRYGAFNLIKHTLKLLKFSKFRNPSSFPGAGIYKLQLKDKSKVVISSFMRQNKYRFDTEHYRFWMDHEINK